MALHLGLSPEDVAKGLAELEIPDGRGRAWSTSRGQRVIADHYNSNPASLRAGLAYLKTFVDRGEGVNLVLGDMLELGPESPRFHSEALAEAVALKPRRIILVGPQFTQAARSLGLENVDCYESSAVAAALIAEDLKSLKGTLLFKGSRGMRLEKLIELL